MRDDDERLPFSPRRERFIEAVVAGNSATQAAKLAGYSAATAYSAGPRLLTNVDVRAEVERRLSRAMIEAGVSPVDAYRALKDSMSDDRPKVRAPRVRAAEIILRASGELHPDTTIAIDARSILLPGAQGASVEQLEPPPGSDLTSN